MGAHRPQQRVLTDREQQPPGEALSRAATQGETDMVDNSLQARSPAREWLRDLLVKSFGEYPPLAGLVAASKSPNHQADPNATAVGGKVSEASSIPAVNPRRRPTAGRTKGGG
jgi:hypothetical protein